MTALQTKLAWAETEKEASSLNEWRQFSWLAAQRGELRVCSSWYKTRCSPGNPPTYVFTVDRKEFSKMDRLPSNSEVLSSLSPTIPSTLRDKWSFLRRMSTECSFLSQTFNASLDTTVLSKATMINWTEGERRKKRQWAEIWLAMLMQDQDDPTVAFLQISLITITNRVPRSFA